MDELKRRFPLAKFVWLPFGAHTDVFYPRKEEKSIFAFWLGRRYEPLHQALLAYCEPRGLRYVYSKDGGLTTEQVGRIDVERTVLRGHARPIWTTRAHWRV